MGQLNFQKKRFCFFASFQNKRFRVFENKFSLALEFNGLRIRVLYIKRYRKQRTLNCLKIIEFRIKMRFQRLFFKF